MDSGSPIKEKQNFDYGAPGTAVLTGLLVHVLLRRLSCRSHFSRNQIVQGTTSNVYILSAPTPSSRLGFHECLSWGGGDLHLKEVLLKRAFTIKLKSASTGASCRS